MSTLDEIRRWLSGENLNGFPDRREEREPKTKKQFLAINYLFNEVKFSETGDDALFVGGLLDAYCVSHLDDVKLAMLCDILDLNERGRKINSPLFKIVMAHVRNRWPKGRAWPTKELYQYDLEPEEHRKQIDELIKKLRREFEKERGE